MSVGSQWTQLLFEKLILPISICEDSLCKIRGNILSSYLIFVFTFWTGLKICVEARILSSFFFFGILIVIYLIFLYLIDLFFNILVHLQFTHTYVHMPQVKRQLAGMASLLPTCRFWILNLDIQGWWSVSLPSESSQWLSVVSYLLLNSIFTDFKPNE